MKNKEVERFAIDGLGSYYISQSDELRFTPWSGGCSISPPQMNIESARNIIFEHAKNRLRCNEVKVRKELTLIKTQQEKLGSDVFNLGQFKVKHDETNGWIS